MSRDSYSHKFVKAFPDKLDDGILYISVDFGTAAHRCFCGCGQEVYTRFSPHDWFMIFDGETVSIKPSIGNWSFRCRSHYWLEKGNVLWAGAMSQEKIEMGRQRDRQRKERHFSAPASTPVRSEPVPATQGGWFTKFTNWLLGR